MNHLIEFWSKFKPVDGINIHPQDKDFFVEKAKVVKKPLLEFSSSVENTTDDRYAVRLGLLPQPYMGDIENSKIIIVMLNPGYAGNEYDEHVRNENSRQAILATIDQDFSGVLSDSRYMYLNHHFDYTDGYKYLCSRSKEPKKGILRDCIEMFASDHKLTIKESIQFMSNNICQIEAFPYHSQGFNCDFNKLKGLPSLIAVNEFLDEKVRDSSNKIFIVSARKALRSDYSKHENVTIFDTRSNYFTKEKHGMTLLCYLNRLWTQASNLDG